jgi:hypothetical protein
LCTIEFVFCCLLSLFYTLLTFVFCTSPRKIFIIKKYVGLENCVYPGAAITKTIHTHALDSQNIYNPSSRFQDHTHTRFIISKFIQKHYEFLRGITRAYNSYCPHFHIYSILLLLFSFTIGSHTATNIMSFCTVYWNLIQILNMRSAINT